MDIHHVLPVAAFALAVAGAAQADGPRPIEAWSTEARPLQAQPVEFGAVSGVASHTVERDGLRVVATLAQTDARGEPGTPLRVEAVLAPGQSVVLSTPRGVGTAPDAVTIVRQDDRVLVCRAAVTNESAADRGAARHAGAFPRPR